MELLLSHDADPAIPDSEGSTPLMAAMYMREMDIVRCLLQKPSVKDNVSVRSTGDRKWTALHIAAEVGDRAITKVLLKDECG